MCGDTARVGFVETGADGVPGSAPSGPRREAATIGDMPRPNRERHDQRRTPPPGAQGRR